MFIKCGLYIKIILSFIIYLFIYLFFKAAPTAYGGSRLGVQSEL